MCASQEVPPLYSKYFINMKYTTLLKRNLDNSDRNIFFDIPELTPVRKLKTVEGGNVYFIPITGFPLSKMESQSVMRFISKLHKYYSDSTTNEITGVLGITSDVLEFEVLEKITKHNFDWLPRMAIALNPDLPAPHTLSRDEVQGLKKGFNIHEIVPMMAYITKSKALNEAYESLFGCGGTIFYLSYLDKQKFFDSMKKVFGHRITDSTFKIVECLPVLGIKALYSASRAQFRALYSACGLYIGESKQDQGVIIISDYSLDTVIPHLIHSDF